jgi:glycosyltransferase involved in cell wall biosynthesis
VDVAAVDGTYVTFVPAGDPEALADAIRAVLSDRDPAEKKAQLLRSHVEQFTWERRMERIVRAAERK